jgi:hypothetical protein
MLSHHGVLYRKGLGVHANGRLDFDVPEGYSRFRSSVGLDGEVKRGEGSVVFALLADGEEIFRSPLLRSGDALVEVDVSVVGKKTLSLIHEDCHHIDGNENRSDHADWLLARVVRDR